MSLFGGENVKQVNARHLSRATAPRCDVLHWLQ